MYNASFLVVPTSKNKTTTKKCSAIFPHSPKKKRNCRHRLMWLVVVCNFTQDYAADLLLSATHIYIYIYIFAVSDV